LRASLRAINQTPTACGSPRHPPYLRNRSADSPPPAIGSRRCLQRPSRLRLLRHVLRRNSSTCSSVLSGPPAASLHTFQSTRKKPRRIFGLDMRALDPDPAALPTVAPPSRGWNLPSAWPHLAYRFTLQSVCRWEQSQERRVFVRWERPDKQKPNLSACLASHEMALAALYIEPISAATARTPEIRNSHRDTALGGLRPAS
jgi:hypothetical protein